VRPFHTAASIEALRGHGSAEAFAAAVQRWPRVGIRPRPRGWLTTTATRRAIDRIRRESQRTAKHEAARMLHDDTPAEPTGLVADDRLRLVVVRLLLGLQRLTCCHPALARKARVALTLRLIGGLSVAEIARAFLVQETTMAQRITRATAKIRAAPSPSECTRKETSGSGSPGCGRWSTSSSTRATSPVKDQTSSGST
jgi:RNA polymerase sigma-70 factor (ECF subfamily)